MTSPWTTCLAFLLFIFSLLLPTPTSPSPSPPPPPHNGICQRKYLRNEPFYLESLRGCRVIEGSLQLAMMNPTTHSTSPSSSAPRPPSTWDNYTFPELREITGYLLVFEVYNLTSLSKLFPNLAVIRGQELVDTHALVINSGQQLQEIGLPSLTDIQRGSVWIVDNSQLCYVDTLDWSLITNESSSDGISSNKPSNHCPNVCHKTCPTSESDRTRQLCWGSAPTQCQKVFKTFCPLCHGRPCTDKGECCSHQCLGGCSGTGPRDCYVCKHVIFNGTCTEECPPGFYEYLHRRCVTRDECLRIQAAPDVSKGGTALLNGKLYESCTTTGSPDHQTQTTTSCKKQCILECPKDTELAPNKKACVPCNGACKKNCPGIQVDSVEKARELAGCTRITGVLKISIRRSTSVTTATIVKELKQNLDKIEEIDDYLVITHTYALFSLDFLENLRVIHGKNLEDSRYALVVRSNENLMELWEGQGQGSPQMPGRGKVTISNKDARILFHYNPKLCPRKIWEFVGSSGIKSPKDDKIDIGITNGDKVTCNTHILNVEIEKKTNNSVLIRYENFRRNLTLTSHLLSYEIHYKEAVQFPGKNVSKYDDRDPCGDDDWTVLEYPKISDADVRGGIQNEPAWEHSRLIANLKHYAWYALYVKTIVIPDENSLNNNTGAESDIIYFQTLPGVPSKPMEVKAASSGPDKISLSWSLPVSPNGELEKFLIWIEPVFENQAFLDQRNYCEKGRVAVKQGGSGSGGQVTPTQSPGGVMKSTVVPGFGFPGIGGSDVTLSKAPANDCCSCSAIGAGQVLGGKTTPPSIEDIHYKDHMTNQIFNLVFIAQPDNQQGQRRDPQGDNQDDQSNSLRVRRAVNLQQDEGGDNSGEKGGNDKLFPGETQNQGGQDQPRVPPEMRVVKEIRVVDGEKRYSYTLRNLTHFTTYKVAIQACRKVEKDNGTASDMGASDGNDTRTCSELALDRVQTAESPTADNIDPSSITTNVTDGNVLRVSWGEPKKPNGVILGYWVKVQRVDGGYPTRHCVTRKSFEKERNFTLPEGLGPGNYSVRIQVASLARDGEWTRDVYFLVREEGGGRIGGGVWAVVVLLPLMVMIGVGGFLAWFYIRQKDIGVRRIISANPEYMSNVDIPEEWEVPRDKLHILDNELGQGSFGTVYEGLLKDFIKGISSLRCAVKTVSDDTPSEERALFLREAALMVKLDCHCHHVVKLLGVVSKTQPTYVVMELMTNGDLKNYLRSRRPGTCNNGEPPPTLRQILRMAAEIADGMSYIHKHKLVHRDLAARNCMVAEDLVVKVGDFGMTKEVIQSDYYRKQTRGLLPVRWMAPESLKDGVFTNQTDVWSFGVVLWEMATLAAQPYQGLSNAQVLDYVVSGRTMERPENCPDILFELMIWCWQVEPRHRPNFIQIIERLSPDLDPSFAQCSFFHSPEGLVYQDNLRLQSKDDALIEIRFDSLTPLATLDDDLDDDLDDYSTDEETALHTSSHPHHFHHPHTSHIIDDTSATRLLSSSSSPPPTILPSSNMRTSSTTSTLLPLHPISNSSPPNHHPHLPPPSKKFTTSQNHISSGSPTGEDVHLLHNHSPPPTTNHPPSPSPRPRLNSNNNNTHPRLPPPGGSSSRDGSTSSINYPSIPNGIGGGGGGDSSSPGGSPWTPSNIQNNTSTSPKCSLQNNKSSGGSPLKNNSSSTENSQSLMINFTDGGTTDLSPPSSKLSNGSNGGGGGTPVGGVPGQTGGNGYIIRRTSPLHHNSSSIDKQPQPVNRTTQC